MANPGENIIENLEHKIFNKPSTTNRTRRQKPSTLPLTTIRPTTTQFKSTTTTTLRMIQSRTTDSSDDLPSMKFKVTTEEIQFNTESTKVKQFQADLKVEPANEADDGPTFKQASLFPTSKRSSVQSLFYVRSVLPHLYSLIIIVLVF